MDDDDYDMEYRARKITALTPQVDILFVRWEVEGLGKRGWENRGQAPVC